MTRSFRPAVVMTLSAALVLATVSVSVAAASAAPRCTSHAVAPDADLPPYDTWISDVTAVTDQAAEYLSTRLTDSSVKSAIVLDIDNTALESNYGSGSPTPATKPVLALAEQAQEAGAAVMFVTARPEILRSLSEQNLNSVGYPNDGLYLRGLLDLADKAKFKTNARIKIEEEGYTIVANIGNNDTDLTGGHAERTFKLPDYNGQLS
jgi:predicted secreted acid phosphatase